MKTKLEKRLIPEPAGSLVIPRYLPETESNSILFSLVIPTYKESKNIASSIALIDDLLHKVLPNQYEMIVVDDDSPDGTWQLALALRAQYRQLRVMRRQQERGLSTAVIRGWQVARGEILGVIDGDLQHPPEILLQLLSASELGADLAVASRHVEEGGVSNWNFMRRFLSRGAQTVGLILVPQVVGRVSDPMSGYFLVKREAIAERELNPLGYKILLEVLGRGRINRIKEVGYIFRERQAGESKVNWRHYLEYLQHLLRLRFPTKRFFRHRQSSKFPFGRFARFCLVGLSGVLVDMIVFYLLSDPSMLAWGLTRSKLIAAECAIINNFCWNDLWTFADISRRQRGWRITSKRFLKFNLICSAGLILNILMLNLLFNLLGIDRYLANLMAIAAVTLWNFWLNFKLSWRVTKVK